MAIHDKGEPIECRFPELWLRVWATPNGIRLMAILYLVGPRYGRRVETIADATWKPSQVTEVSVVDWGQRALSAWLARQLGAEEAGSTE